MGNTSPTRRRVLGAIAAGLSTSLAGCPADGDINGDTGGGGGPETTGSPTASSPTGEPTEALVQHYRFDGSSFPCDDYAGDATATPIENAELGAPGQHGSALDVTGGGIQWAASDEPERQGAAVTVSFWLKTLAEGLPGINLVYRSALAEHFINVDGTTAQFVFDDADDIRHKLFLPESSFNDGGWHHLVQRWDGTTHDLWLDGERRSSETVEGTGFRGDEQPGAIGAKPDRSDNYPCLIDDFRVYSRAISDAEVRRLHPGDA